MSGRRNKHIRGLAHHAEYGAYYPAADRSRAALDAMDLSPRRRRRAESLSYRKIRKAVEREARGTGE